LRPTPSSIRLSTTQLIMTAEEHYRQR